MSHISNGIPYPWEAGQAFAVLAHALENHDERYLETALNRTSEDFLELIETMNKMIALIIAASGSELDIDPVNMFSSTQRVLHSLDEYASLVIKLKSI